MENAGGFKSILSKSEQTRAFEHRHFFRQSPAVRQLENRCHQAPKWWTHQPGIPQLLVELVVERLLGRWTDANMLSVVILYHVMNQKEDTR